MKAKYYIESQRSIYSIAKTYHADRATYTAFTRRRAGSENPGKWSRFDSGWLGSFPDLQSAVRCCENYEYDYQAGQINGLYYGNSDFHHVTAGRQRHGSVQQAAN